MEVYEKEGLLNYKASLISDTSQAMTGFFYPDSDSTYTENGSFIRLMNNPADGQLYFRASAGSATVFELFKKDWNQLIRRYAQ